MDSFWGNLVLVVFNSNIAPTLIGIETATPTMQFDFLSRRLVYTGLFTCLGLCSLQHTFLLENKKFIADFYQRKKTL